MCVPRSVACHRLPRGFPCTRAVPHICGWTYYFWDYGAVAGLPFSSLSRAGIPSRHGGRQHELDSTARCWLHRFCLPPIGHGMAFTCALLFSSLVRTVPSGAAHLDLRTCIVRSENRISLHRLRSEAAVVDWGKKRSRDFDRTKPCNVGEVDVSTAAASISQTVSGGWRDFHLWWEAIFCGGRREGGLGHLFSRRLVRHGYEAGQDLKPKLSRAGGSERLADCRTDVAICALHM